MKRIGCLLLGAALTGAGCTLEGTFVQKAAPPVSEKPVDLPAPPAVIEADVTEQNAKEKARALRDEMLRDGRKPGSAKQPEVTPGEFTPDN